jgi:hypothetical protein
VFWVLCCIDAVIVSQHPAQIRLSDSHLCALMFYCWIQDFDIDACRQAAGAKEHDR